MSDHRGEQLISGEAVQEVYEPPTLIHVGNLHDILADNSASALCDNTFGQPNGGHDVC